MLHTVFITEHYKKSIWHKSYAFYEGPIVGLDLPYDKRFCSIKDKRKQAIFVGLVKGLEFPVKFPLKTMGGKIIEELI